MKQIHSRRGFIFSVDSLIALGLALAIIGLVIPFMESSGLPNHDQLHIQRYTADLLFVMQKSGNVRVAIEGDETGVLSLFSQTGTGKCFTFKATNTDTSAMVISATKPGCTGRPTTLSSAVSNEYYNGHIYRLELLGWMQ